MIGHSRCYTQRGTIRHKPESQAKVDIQASDLLPDIVAVREPSPVLIQVLEPQVLPSLALQACEIILFSQGRNFKVPPLRPSRGSARLHLDAQILHEQPLPLDFLCQVVLTGQDDHGQRPGGK